MNKRGRNCVETIEINSFQISPAMEKNRVDRNIKEVTDIFIVHFTL